MENQPYSAKHKIFAAYARNDFARVQAIIKRLERSGIAVTYDLASLEPGDLFADKLEDLIRNSDTVLFILSPASMRSQWCKAEARFAAQLNKRILPVKVVDVSDAEIPLEISRYQWIDFTDPDDDSAFDALVRAVRAGAQYGAGSQSDNLFISYRRQESSHVAGRIYDHLEREFGQSKVFLDVEAIPIGSDFRSQIRGALLDCTAMVLVIGRRWSKLFERGVFGSWGDRVDYVPTEIELALEHSVRILPILVDGAEMPQKATLPKSVRQVCHLQAAPIRAGLDFRTDIARVTTAIRNPPHRAI